MLTWMIRVRRFIRKVMHARTEGGGHIYFFALFIILFLLVLFKMSYNKERIYITYDTVEDSLMTALVSSCVCNVAEYGISDQLVIYRNLTPPKVPSIFDAIINAGGGPVLPLPPPYDPLNDPEIYSPNGDEYLDNCYETFCDNLVHNLKLDSNMNATISGIDGIVSIAEFSVYNVYRAFDTAGNETGYRIVKYTRTDNGNWTVHDYGIDMPARAYSSLTKSDVEITETSVSAALSFDVVLSEYTPWLMQGLSENDMTNSVTYQRVVDVTNQ